MSEIIVTMPWYTHERDRAKPARRVLRWHMVTVWHHDDGTYSADMYSNGEHEKWCAGDVPNAEIVKRGWTLYFQDMARTGEDQLNALHLPTDRKIRRHWQADLAPWLGGREHGLLINGVRRRGRGEWIRDLDAWPQSVREYLNAQRTNVRITSPDFHTMEELSQAVANDKDARLFNNGRLNFVIEEQPKPWSENRKRAWLRREAKRRLLAPGPEPRGGGVRSVGQSSIRLQVHNPWRAYRARLERRLAPFVLALTVTRAGSIVSPLSFGSPQAVHSGSLGQRCELARANRSGLWDRLGRIADRRLGAASGSSCRRDRLVRIAAWACQPPCREPTSPPDA